ncbi:Hsp20/alpha crystallin family protein [Amycolatopsis taiwanensis]|uniref:Hsp20/alpha crystallin family protein n=1 Tax=Amycolatopsis taiwanensis TaxID=342230 RepID=UPI000483795F|nr:Hsp20/alpha crystallin family protein [Amycolatopsis taiwanensis]
MTSMLPRGRTLFPGLIDWLESPWPFGERNLVRVEERVGDGNYIVRAELPGFDPNEHIHVSTEGGVLTIDAERESSTKEAAHSEFRYGKFHRAVSLPEGADTTKITAKYTDGILEITIPVQLHEHGKTVDVRVEHD